MPNKGAALAMDENENPKNLVVEAQKNEQIFTKIRPKSALYDKFARPNTGKHSIYKKNRDHNLYSETATNLQEEEYCFNFSTVNDSQVAKRGRTASARKQQRRGT